MRGPFSRHFLAPEVIQSSAMDCGPAALKCLLDGHGIPASYGRLREACQTGVDGTSIDVMEEVAVQLGLAAEQIMIPADHLLLAAAAAIPALVVVRLPNGNTHFVVLWRRVGNWVQVMDPGVGRRWIRCKDLLNELYRHTMAVPASGWREWAGSDDFLIVLKTRMHSIGLTQKRATRLIDQAMSDPEWASLAALDAATRMVASLTSASGLRRDAPNILDRIFAQSQQDPAVIPELFWSARPATDEEDEEDPTLLMHGAVLVRIRQDEQVADEPGSPEEVGQTPLAPELAAALAEPQPRPILALLRMVLADGWGASGVVLFALLGSACTVLLEALLLRGLLDVGEALHLARQRGVVLIAILLFLLVKLGFDAAATDALRRMGRHLEIRLRMAFLEKIPQLNDRYFQSRLVSDMAERSHSLYRLRLLPLILGSMVRVIFLLLLTMAGLLWLAPANSLLIVAAALLAIVIPLLAQPLLAERDLRVRSHLGALSRFYLDGMLGLVPIRVHGAGRAVRGEHESLVVEWARASWRFYGTVVAAETVQAGVGFGLTIWLVFDFLAQSGNISGLLLLVYWSLSLPIFGQELSLLVRQIPSIRNIALRLLEPLQTPKPSAVKQGDEMLDTDCRRGVQIDLQNVHVRVGGHTILHSLATQIQPGEHVAIVGPSGAGKSTLLGLLLGWHRVGDASLLVDGLPLTETVLAQLQSVTAWVDPAVQLWNDTFYENLRYGQEHTAASIAGTMEAADLQSVLERLPNGLQTALGEGGGLLSGGEGQRLRLGRALLRDRVRLALLDEPFRGLDRAKRLQLLAQTRQSWQGATLLCVTHDIAHTRDFDRVLVIDSGTIVEDGNPLTLLEEETSRYGQLVEADVRAQADLWSSRSWRKLRLVAGKLVEGGVAAHDDR